MGIPNELVELISDMYREPTFAVKEGKARSSERKQNAVNTAAELLLQKIQIESEKYNLSLNLNKCVILRLNSIHNVHFLNGDALPVAYTATYLGSSISANGNQHSEIKNRISVTLMTLKQLNVFWTKSPASIKWKLR
eukprot:8548897-Heterocapsa_arctica.AAC.1